MRELLILTLAALAPMAATAQDVAAAAPELVADAAEEVRGTPDLPFDGAEIEMRDFLWTARPIVVFADTPADPAFQQQMELLRNRPEALAERDVVVITDTDPEARSDVRLSLRPRGFMMVIIGKDGQVEIRKPRPWDVREITRTIDKMPLRQQEIRERGLGGG